MRNNNQFRSVSRSQLITRLADKQRSLTPNDVKAAVEVILDYMGESFREGKRIEIRKFGSFSIHKHKQKMTHNLKTSKTVLVPERNTPHFKPSASLKESINASRTFNTHQTDDSFED